MLDTSRCGTRCFLQTGTWISASLLWWVCVWALASGAARAADSVQVAVTSINGTWSTGTGAVSTGESFFNLVNNTFNVPALPGQAYSFSMINRTNGFWEQALYTINNTGTSAHSPQTLAPAAIPRS